MDHFKTQKGKKLLLSPGQAIKLVLVLVLIFFKGDFFIYVYYVLFIAYVLEVGFFAYNFFGKLLKRPKWTKKTIFLFLVSCAFFGMFAIVASGQNNQNQVFWILIADILTFAVISLLILLFQPFFVIARNLILRKAKEQMEKIKSVSGLTVIAVTGSYGKTSTKEFLTTILSKKFKVLATKEHQNSEIGVARTVLNELKPSHQIFIAEVGAYNKGKVKQVCQIIQPRIGVVTGVNEQHMALFGSMENLLSAEGGGELLEMLPEDGTIFVNGENNHCLNLIKQSAKLPPEREKIYALSNKVVGADIWAEAIDVKKESVSFVATDKTGNLANFEASVLGGHNVQNLLGAMLIASEFGMSFGEISEALREIKPAQSGMVLKHGKHGINVVDSSYSANPDGAMADMEYLKVFPGKRVLVMPCLIELGKESKKIHVELGKKIAEICDLAIITTKDKFKEIQQGFNSDILENKRILLCKNPQDIYSTVTSFCKAGDAVLLEGRVPSHLIKLLSE